MRTIARHTHKLRPRLLARASPECAPVHALLTPQELSRAEALAACEAHLARRFRLWKVARRLVPPSAREGFVAVLAWHELARELAELPPGFERRRSLEELLHELELALREDARSAAGRALSFAVRRHELSEELLRRPALERRREEHLATFETREALLGHARALAVPEARLYLALLGTSGARAEVLADTCALALQLTHWLTHLGPDLGRGVLHLPMDELLRAGVALGELTPGAPRARPSPALAHVLAAEVARARELYARGWELCALLGPVRGRALAFVLRWNAAALGALEARGLDALRGPPPAGWLRLAACLTTSLASTAPPRLA